MRGAQRAANRGKSCWPKVDDASAHFKSAGRSEKTTFMPAMRTERRTCSKRVQTCSRSNWPKRQRETLSPERSTKRSSVAMAAAARQLLGAAPRNNPPNNGGRLRPVIPRQPVLDRTKKATPKFARPSKPPQRLVELKKPPRMIDLYDTAELLHRSKTGTELVVGIHKLTGETVVIKRSSSSTTSRQQLLVPVRYAKLNHQHLPAL